MSFNRLRKQFATSKSRAVNGVWFDVDLRDGGKPLRFLLARWGRTNQKWVAMQSRFQRENARKIDANMMTHEDWAELSLKCFCGAVLLDWENVDDERNNPLPYTPEAGYRMMKEFDTLYDYLLEESQTLQNYQEFVTEEAVGNSPPTTDGS